MPLQEVRALSYPQIVEFVKGHPVTLLGSAPLPSLNDIWVIGITDPSTPPVLSSSDKVLVLQFLDADPQNPEYQVPPDNPHQYMTPEQAKEVVDFLERVQKAPGNVLLLVHCHQGMCRSGAVIDFAATVFGLGFWDTRTKNPQIVPNHWVRYLLFKEWFTRKLGKMNSQEQSSEVLR